MSSFLWGLLGGFAAWFGSTFLAAPLYRYWKLRQEAAHALVFYGNVGADSEHTDEAVERYRRLASSMMAFYQTELLAPRLLHSRGHDPLAAGKALMSFSNEFRRYGQDRADARRAVCRALNLKSID